MEQVDTAWLANDAIAARAGGHRTTVQIALRKARELGLITVQNRGRHGQRNAARRPERR
jgi:hypothetical protein